MNFTDAIFLPVILLIAVLYYLVPLVVRPYLLLLWSLLFYCTWGPEKLPFIVGGAVIAWAAALVISKKPKSRTGKAVMLIAVILLVGTLVFLKTARHLFEGDIIVPLGISYYTLALTGYVLDVYYGRIKADKNYFQVLSFAAFFPGILQGPIARYKHLSPQLREGHRFDYKKVCFGMQLALYGFFKKLVIADRLALYTNTVFSGDSFNKYSGSVILAGLLFRSIQLYCDFSGYMDIAAGIAQVFGVEITRNFNHPFFSRSAAEFWRRWHISLGAWFKDFVYMPLMVSPAVMKTAQSVKKLFGKRAGKAVVTLIPVYCVWILTGLWHGTSRNYVIWGIYWGTIIAFSTIYAQDIRKVTKWLHINTGAESWKIFQMVRTFILFTIGRTITLDKPLQTVQRMLREFNVSSWFDGTLYTIGMDRPNFILALLSIAFVWFISLQQEKYSVREKIASFNIVFRWLIYYAAILAVVIFGMYGLNYDASAFIYMQY